MLLPVLTFLGLKYKIKVVSCHSRVNGNPVKRLEY